VSQATGSNVDAFRFEDLSRRRYESLTGFRIFYGFFAFIGTLFLLWFGIDYWRGGHDLTPTLLLASLEGTCILVIGTAIVFLMKSRLAATSVRILGGGVEFNWPSGRSANLGWRDLASGFLFLDHTANEYRSRTQPEYRWSIRHWSWPSTAVPKEAFDAILAGATQAGMRLDSRFEPNPFWGWGPCQVTRVTLPRESASRQRATR
jgi:hypothetical protein